MWVELDIYPPENRAKTVVADPTADHEMYQTERAERNGNVSF